MGDVIPFPGKQANSPAAADVSGRPEPDPARIGECADNLITELRNRPINDEGLLRIIEKIRILSAEVAPPPTPVRDRSRLKPVH